MSTIKIGQTEVPLEQADEGWINQQINGRRADGALVCVQVTLFEGEVNVVLRTPTCGNGGGGGRLPNEREKRIFQLWDERGLNSPDFTGGNLVGFLRQLRRIL